MGRATSKGQGITDQQETFCREYITDFNGLQSAIRAGYSEKTAKEQSSRLLTSVNIQRRVAELINEKMKKVDAKVERILKELYLIALSDIADLFEWGEREIHDANGDFLYKTEELKLKPKEVLGHKTRRISEITQTKTVFGTTMKVKQYDKLKAIELLGKYHGMFRERLEVTGQNGQPIQTTVTTKIDLSKLSPEELKALRSVIKKSEEQEG